jgi:hypothetical protein
MLDILEKHLLTPEKVSLSEEQAQRLARLKSAYELLRDEPSRRRIVSKLMALYGIKERTAYNDIHDSQKLFSAVYRYDNDFLRNVIVENALEQMRIAKQSGGRVNHKAWTEAQNTLLKVYLADKGDNDKIDPSMLGNNTYLVMMPSGDKVLKYNLMEMDKLPAAQRESLVEKLFAKEINEIEAAEIINPKRKNANQGTDTQPDTAC